MTARVLVTGATGFVGAAVVERLLAENVVVRAAARTKQLASPSGAEWITVPALDAMTDWRAAVDGVHTVVHCAARVHLTHDGDSDPLAAYRRVNRDGTAALARQSAAAGVRRFVFISSIKVNGESTAPGRPFRFDDRPSPEDPYGVSKHEAEVALRDIEARTGMAVVVIRPPLVYGPGVKANFKVMLEWVRSGFPLPLGAVDNRRSMVALDNLVDLVALCCSHPEAAGGTFLVSDGDDLSTTRLLRLAGQAMGRPTRLVPIPGSWLANALRAVGRTSLSQRLCGSLTVDIEPTRRQLGWVPPIGVDAAMRLTTASLLGIGR